jgi:hypothetical protein
MKCVFIDVSPTKKTYTKHDRKAISILEYTVSVCLRFSILLHCVDLT